LRKLSCNLIQIEVKMKKVVDMIAVCAALFTLFASAT